MTITFFVEGAPYEDKKEECLCVANDPDGKPWDTCPSCRGSGTEIVKHPLYPELNLAHDNAFMMMELMGLHSDYGGEADPEFIPLVMRKLIFAVNSEKTREQYQCETVIEGKRIQVGRDDGYILSRCMRLLDVFKKAQDNQLAVLWG